MKRLEKYSGFMLLGGLGLVIGCAGNGTLGVGSTTETGGKLAGASTTTGGSTPGYTFRAIGDMEGGKFWSSAVAVSDDGQFVVGTGYNGDGRRAWRWSESSGFQAITGLPGDTDAASVSSDGSIVFGWTTTNRVVTEAFVWDWFNGMKRLSGMPSGMYAREIGACSADGKRAAILGSTSKGRQGLIWDELTVFGVDSAPLVNDFVVVRGLSDDGLIAAGTRATNIGTEAVVWMAGAGGGIIPIGDIVGGKTQSRVMALSGNGQVVVGVGNSDFGNEAMRWSVETGAIGMSDFAGGPYSSQANAVSRDGTTIVGWGTDAIGRQAFIWNKTDGIEYLDRILRNAGVALKGFRIESANGISRDGKTIVGHCVNPKGETEAFIATLP